MTITNSQEIRDGIIRKGLLDHFTEAKEYFSDNNIVGLFLQGSQNYGLDTPHSDIDTKLIITPSFKDLALNHKPVSTTHVRANDERIDFKDIRLYIETFRKQNLNFLEILFTDYFIINPMYVNSWNKLLDAREEIARMNPFRAVKSMKGIALEKYHAMEHPYPSKLDVLAKYGYDPKQLHHLVRVDNYLTRYINGESYKDCLVPNEQMKKFLLDIKQGQWELAAARELADISLEHITKIADDFCAKLEDKEDEAIRQLLEEVSYEIMKISVSMEVL